MGIKAEEFNLKKGLLLAVMCGIFSAGDVFAMNAAKPMHEAAAALGVDPLYVALPSYVVIMGGGALVNLGFCFIRGKSAKSVDKSRLLAGKTVDYQQYSAVRAWRSDVVFTVLFSMHGVTRAFQRNMTT